MVPLLVARSTLADDLVRQGRKSPSHVRPLRHGDGLMIRKHDHFRSRKLLDAARDCPVCMDCGKANDGTVVAAHSNQSRDGKGAGIKADDFRVAFICMSCHSFIDQGNASRAERQGRWEEAHRATVGYLFKSGLIEVV